MQRGGQINSSKLTWNLKRVPLKRFVITKGPLSGSVSLLRMVSIRISSAKALRPGIAGFHVQHPARESAISTHPPALGTDSLHPHPPSSNPQPNTNPQPTSYQPSTHLITMPSPSLSHTNPQPTLYQPPTYLTQPSTYLYQCRMYHTNPKPRLFQPQVILHQRQMYLTPTPQIDLIPNVNLP